MLRLVYNRFYSLTLCQETLVLLHWAEERVAAGPGVLGHSCVASVRRVAP